MSLIVDPHSFKIKCQDTDLMQFMHQVYHIHIYQDKSGQRIVYDTLTNRAWNMQNNTVIDFDVDV